MQLLSAGRIYLGTMNFAWKQASSTVDVAAATEQLRIFADAGGRRLDTARIYAGGDTEPMVAAVEGCPGAWRLGTKAAPSVAGGLSAAGFRAQFDASRAALRTTAPLSEYYLHQPDTATDLVESLAAADALVKAGGVEEIGLSNYHADEVARCFELCEKEGFAKPTVYQGLYNPLNRAVEAELLPLLQSNGCRFVAYNPLAAGLLTGVHTSPDAVAKGRFLDNPNYLPRFYTEANFKALAPIRAACDAAGVSMVAATYAWLLRYSALSEADGVLLGASSAAHLTQNVDACRGDGVELPDSVLAALDGAYDITREGAFKYWRSFSADFPGREDRDQGASYQAAKAKA